jgi:hypothetical protein
MAETLRLNTTITSLDLYRNRLGEGGWRALAEALGLNTTVTSLNLNGNGLGEEVSSVLPLAWETTGEGHSGLRFVSSKGQLHIHTYTQDTLVI